MFGIAKLRILRCVNTHLTYKCFKYVKDKEFYFCPEIKLYVFSSTKFLS